MKHKKTAISLLAVAFAICIAAAVFINTMYSSGNLRFVHKIKTPEPGQIKVACVGDSVTYGMNMENWEQNAYPVVLQQMLGSKYCVNNYGYSGRTVQQGGTSPTSMKQYIIRVLILPLILLFFKLDQMTQKRSTGKTVRHFTTIIPSLQKAIQSLRHIQKYLL